MAGEPAGKDFEHLREHSIGLPQVLFQSITHMAPAAAVAYSLFISVPDAQQALPLAVALALIACLCAATAIGQLAKLVPSAGGLYAYAARSLGPWAGFLTAWLFVGFQPLVAPFLYLEFSWAMSDVFTERGRLALQRPVVDLGAADGGHRVPADVPRHPHLDDGGRDPRRVRDRDLRGARDLDDRLERRRSEPAAVQPESRRRRLERRLQGNGVRDPRLHRLRGVGAARRGSEEPAALDPAGRRRLRLRDRPLLSAVLVRVGVRSRLQRLRRAGDRRRSVAQPRQGLLGLGLDPRVPRDLQLDRGELERGGERGDPSVLRARAQRARARAARPHAQEVQDAEHRDHLDDRSSRSCSRWRSAGSGAR